MASRQDIRISLGGIDLNVAPTNDELDNRVIQAEETQNHLPDLNLNPHSTSIESSSSHNNFLFDLNSEPNMEDDDTHAEESNLSSAQSRTRRNLNNAERNVVHELLLKKSVDGKLKHGTTKLVASLFSVNISTIQRIWRRSKNSIGNVDVSSRKAKKCGRKKVHLNFDRVRDIPLNQRTTLRSLAHSVGASMSTLHRVLKEGGLRRHSNAIKPVLKEGNKRSRLQFCISMLQESSIPHDPTFKGMHNIIHIDEKWFYMTKKSEKYYLLPAEKDPIRTCKSKNFIVKIMFLVAIARPRFDTQQNEVFSGKIGVFPLVTQEVAKRNSVNRAVGTLETKPITSITREVIRYFLVHKVLPAIKEKWPREDVRYPIFIQQDNARTHINDNDAEFCQAASGDGFDIRLMCQPPNSPDLNILDLGFFSAIQSLQHREAPTTVDELINAVVKSFENFSTVMSNRIFLTLQSCMIEIMKSKGSQRYKIPHMKKALLERQDQLPTQLKCDSALVQEVLDYLNSTS